VRPTAPAFGRNRFSAHREEEEREGKEGALPNDYLALSGHWQMRPFKKIEELMNVRGVGEKNFLKLKPQISVASRPEGASAAK
jgi:type II secretory pathway component PulK